MAKIFQGKFSGIFRHLYIEAQIERRDLANSSMIDLKVEKQKRHISPPAAQGRNQRELYGNHSANHVRVQCSADACRD
jgi:hypothetical protein